MRMSCFGACGTDCPPGGHVRKARNINKRVTKHGTLVLRVAFLRTVAQWRSGTSPGM